MNEHGHYWSECAMCGPMVVCGRCGNGTCNGGHGEEMGSEPGSMIPCRACPSAYEMYFNAPPETKAAIAEATQGAPE